MIGLEELSHPAMRPLAGSLQRILETPPTGLFKWHPELSWALRAQLPGLVSRDLMFAHNSTLGSGMLTRLRRGEGQEIRESLVDTVKKNEKVNGATSLEGADYLVFSSLEIAVAGVEGKQLSLPKLAEIELGVATLGLMRRLLPGFDHISAIGPTIEKNWQQNYPVMTLKAPADWDQKQMTDYYLAKTKPALDTLRNVFSDHKLPVLVAEHLNERRQTPPEIFDSLPQFAPAYLEVLANIAV